jgi:uncharacterized protein (DUF885 family)
MLPLFRFSIGAVRAGAKEIPACARVAARQDEARGDAQMKYAIAALLALSPVAAEADDYAALEAAYWQAWRADNPLAAADIDGRMPTALGDPSLAAIDRRAAFAADLLKRADKIDQATLSPDDRTDFAVLKRLIAEDAELGRYPQRAVTMTSYYSWLQVIASLPERLRIETAADLAAYVALLRQVPAYNRAAIETTRAGLKLGVAQPCAPFERFENSVRPRAAAVATAASPYYVPFKRVGGNAAEAAPVIATVHAAFAETLDFYLKEVRPACRATVGVSATPQGAAFYAFRARAETTTDLTPAQIHDLGLAEVDRIRAEMDKVVAASGFAGDRAAYIAMLRREPRYYAKTPDELMREAAYLAKVIDGEMPRLFGRLPRLPYTVKPIPEATAPFTTTAYYESGSPATGRAGVYRVNTSKLDQRPLFELPALTVHEAVPGHHHQIALQQELDLPDFRKHAAGFTAFVEGWALYAESLGEEMGLYDTSEKKMGRLSYEMWRACRLVVDTGIHAKGWSKQQAVDFMLANTALSAANIDAEVSRYISWPGQALAYKIGELRIKELRRKAERELGARFDLRAFHDAVLLQGAVPLDVVEAQVDAWIGSAKRSTFD